MGTLGSPNLSSAKRRRRSGRSGLPTFWRRGRSDEEVVELVNDVSDDDSDVDDPDEDDE